MAKRWVAATLLGLLLISETGLPAWADGFNYESYERVRFSKLVRAALADGYVSGLSIYGKKYSFTFRFIEKPRRITREESDRVGVAMEMIQWPSPPPVNYSVMVRADGYKQKIYVQDAVAQYIAGERFRPGYGLDARGYVIWMTTTYRNKVPTTTFVLNEYET